MKPLDNQSIESTIMKTPYSQSYMSTTDVVLNPSVNNSKDQIPFKNNTQKQFTIEQEDKTHNKESLASLHAVKEKTLHNHIESRFALMEHLYAGHVSEDEKLRAAEEATKTNRRMSLEIHKIAHMHDNAEKARIDAINGDNTNNQYIN